GLTICFEDTVGASPSFGCRRLHSRSRSRPTICFEDAGGALTFVRLPSLTLRILTRVDDLLRGRCRGPRLRSAAVAYTPDLDRGRRSASRTLSGPSPSFGCRRSRSG